MPWIQKWRKRKLLAFPVLPLLIEYSENKIITHFENKVGPEVLRSSIRQTQNLQKFSHSTYRIDT